MKLQTQLIILIVTQFFTIAVLLITNLVNRRYTAKLLRDKIRIEKNIDYLEKQIRELYSPVYILLKINKEIVKSTRFDPDKGEYNKTVPDEVWKELREKIIIPNNQAILDILKKNIYLLDKGSIDKSFLQFILHAGVYPTAFSFNLKQEDYLLNFTFPSEFSDYIFGTTERLIDEYSAAISLPFK
jgi:hypothetical protein